MATTDDHTTTVSDLVGSLRRAHQLCDTTGDNAPELLQEALEHLATDAAPFRYRSRYWSFLLKLHPDQPAPTIPAQRVTYNGPFHWNGRHLRIRELARLQTFPDWQPLSRQLTEARRHVGNAVPVLLAASVVHHVCCQLDLLDGEDTPDALQLAADPAATYADVTAAYPKHSE